MSNKLLRFVEMLNESAERGDTRAKNLINKLTSFARDEIKHYIDNTTVSGNLEESADQLVPLSSEQEHRYAIVLDKIGDIVEQDINSLIDDYGLREGSFVLGLKVPYEDFMVNLVSIFWNFLSEQYTPYEIVSMVDGTSHQDWDALQ